MRPRSVHTSTCRSDHLSTQTPAGRPKTRCGAMVSAESKPISTADACSVTTATSGRATVVIALPDAETS